MDVDEAIRTRRSIRSWEKRSIPRETLEELLEAARLAPASKNLQLWEIIAVTDREILRELVPVCNGQRHVGEAGAFLFIVSDPSAKWTHVDPAIAMDHLTLRAREMGLGTCWIGAFNEIAMRSALGIPDNKVAVIGLTVGYPADEPRPRGRSSLQDLVHWERY
jgi:nitroreductase